MTQVSRGDDGRDTSAGAAASNAAVVMSLGVIYVATSAGLISFNKYLIHRDRFPFAVALVLCHTLFCSACTLAMYLGWPSLFPSLTCPERRVVIDSRVILKGAVPVATLFSVQLILSNTAFLHSSVAFLQMVKEANVVLVYTFSLLLALERFSWRNVSILFGILVATTMTIHGEIRFSWTGFAMQGISQVFESLKIVLQAVLLSSAGWKLDPLTYVLVVMPLCFLILSTVLGALVFIYPMKMFETPSWADMAHWWPLLLANSLVAFALNVIIAFFVKSSSAIAFILAGILKDVMIVAAGGLLFQEAISLQQVLGFTLQCLFILLWSLVKTFPDRFKAGVFVGMWSLCKGQVSISNTAAKTPSAGSYGTVARS